MFTNDIAMLYPKFFLLFIILLLSVVGLLVIVIALFYAIRLSTKREDELLSAYRELVEGHEEDDYIIKKYYIPRG